MSAEVCRRPTLVVIASVVKFHVPSQWQLAMYHSSSHPPGPFALCLGASRKNGLSCPNRLPNKFFSHNRARLVLQCSIASSDMAISAFTTLINPLSIAPVLVVYIVLSHIAAWYRLRHLNGPWLGKFSYLFMFWAQSSGRSWGIYTKLNKKYGPLVRIGPNDLVTDDPDVIRRMSGVRSTYKRSNWYQAGRLNPHEVSLISTLDTDDHDKLKARAAFGYNGKENTTLEASIDSQIAEMASLLKRKYLSTSEELKPMDFGRVGQYFTLDTITKIAYGDAFGYLRTDSDVYGYVKAVEVALPVLQVCGDISPLQPVLLSPTLLRLLGPTSKDENGLGKLMGHVTS